MAKNDKVIRLGRKITRIFKNYCRENNIDMKKFLEEAIVEKLEVERLSSESDYFNYFDATPEEMRLDIADEPAPGEQADKYKRRH